MIHDLTNLFNPFLQTVKAFSSDASQSTPKFNNCRGSIKGFSSFDISNRDHLNRNNINQHKDVVGFVLQVAFGQLWIFPSGWSHTEICPTMNSLLMKELSTKVSPCANMSSKTFPSLNTGEVHIISLRRK